MTKSVGNVVFVFIFSFTWTYYDHKGFYLNYLVSAIVRVHCNNVYTFSPKRKYIECKKAMLPTSILCLNEWVEKCPSVFVFVFV